ncbi:M4 family metallopeptidase [Spirillospora sp. CA-294931]|uniref:M4 family metallopeptidase n=1 Tax=Spirillospora sp. CA-294931 TaxID=3240042 RepID=UPI003D9195DA
MRPRRATPVLALTTALAAVLVAPAFSTAPPPQSPASLAVAAADRLVGRETARIHLSPRDRLVRQRVIAGSGGLHYVPYTRTYAGLPVSGGDLVVVTDARGRVLSTSVNQKAPLSVATTPKVPASGAATAARGRLRGASASTPRLAVIAEGAGRLVYQTVLTGSKDGKPSRLHVDVDAGTGKVVRSWDEVTDGTGHGHHHGTVDVPTTRSATTYGMADPGRPGVRCGDLSGRTFTDPDDVWGDHTGTDLVTACVDAMHVAQRGWDMLANWLGRNGYDGNGRGFPMRVGLDDENAYWDGTSATFGHNLARTKQVTNADIVGHELGHAVFQWTPGGASGLNEKGGLNESTGDIFGTMTEWYLNSPYDRPDYLMGETVNLVGTGPIRSMYDPAALGDPGCFSEAVRVTEVHAAAGVQNHWFYLLAEGSRPNDPANGRPNSPTCDGSVLAGIGREKAARIYMEGLNRKTSWWAHEDARRATLEAALQLHPGSCREFRAVRDAWNAVRVPRHASEPAPAQCA